MKPKILVSIYPQFRWKTKLKKIKNKGISLISCWKLKNRKCL